jgi:hypothetical protein
LQIYFQDNLIKNHSILICFSIEGRLRVRLQVASSQFHASKGIFEGGKVKLLIFRGRLLLLLLFLVIMLYLFAFGLTSESLIAQKCLITQLTSKELWKNLDIDLLIEIVQLIAEHNNFVLSLLRNLIAKLIPDCIE